MRVHAATLALAAVLLLAGALVALDNMRRIAANEALVRHSGEVLEALSQLESLLTSAESAARGFLVSADPVYLEPYRESVATIGARLKRLRWLVIEEPEQRAHVPVLRRFVAGRLAELERTTRLRREGFEAARTEMLSDLGRATMDVIRGEISEASRVERRLLAERQGASARAYQIAVSNVLLVLAVGLFLIAVAAVLARRDLAARARVTEELERADERKNEFLATVAHELRNPLAPLAVAVETLDRSGERRGTARRAREILRRQVALMSRLVEDLLDVGRITRGVVELQRETLDLAGLVSETVETCAPPGGSARHEVRVSLPRGPLWVSADPVRLAQIFTNIVTNAMKYSPEGGPIDVAVLETPTHAVVRVRDHGIGIPPEMLPYVFEMYAQVEDGRGHSRGGLGIGLAVARQLLAMQDATIEARSPGPGRGSEFTVRFPRAPEPAPGPVRAVAETTRPGARPMAAFGRRVLVVDDSADAADGLAGFLELLGHETRTAFDGPSALEMLREFRPEVVLLDISLPGMSGYDVARAIRSDPAFAHVVLVAQTGWAREEDRRRSAEAGFDHHLVKPVDPRVLQELLGSLQ